MGGGNGGYEPDPNVGKAALLSAQTGQDYLDVMKGQMAVSNRWAGEDRARYQKRFQPVENQYVADAKKYDSPLRQNQAAREARADVFTQADIAKEQSNRELAAMGVNPKSGRFRGINRAQNFDTALAAVGASNLAREEVRSTADTMRTNVLNMGKGFAVNPATSLGLSNSAASAGFSGAMQGYGQQGAMLAQQDRTAAAAQQDNSGLWGALGTVAGVMPWASILSDETKKKNKKEAPSGLGIVRKSPATEWEYKDEVGDEPGKRHVGPMAQQFQKASGMGDGKTINVGDAIGVHHKAIEELGDKVDKLERSIKRPQKQKQAA